MEPVIARRLATMERRIAALELALDQARVARPVPRPPKAPPPLPTAATNRPPTRPAEPPRVMPVRAPGHASAPRVATTPAKPTPPKPEHTKPTTPTAPDWERFFGLAVLGRIGVAAVLLAAGYFAQLAYRGLPPIGKVLSIYALGAAFLGVGAWLRPRVASRFTALLWAGGTASLYLAAVAAHLRYNLVGDSLALLLLLFACAVGHGLARALRHQTLASMTLAGAFAAPWIADASLANGPFLMLYLLLLHGWSAWVEERWRWQSARVVSVVGTTAVALRWLWLHGGLDAATLLLVHGYVFGLMAPELFRVLREKTVELGRRTGIPLALAIVEGLVVLVCLRLIPGLEQAATTVPLLAGLAWTGIACALMPYARGMANTSLVAGLARVGQLLTVLGVAIATQALPTDFALEPETVIVWGVALAGLGALALRRHLGVGDLAAAVAAPLACVTAVVPASAQHVFALFPVAAAMAAAVVYLARHPMARGVAAWSGLIALGVGLAAGTRFGPQDTIWVAIALVAAAAWSWALIHLARATKEHGLALQGVLQLWLVGFLWAMHAFTHLSGVRVPLVDPMTLAALIIAGAAAHAAWLWRRDRRTVAGAAISLWLLVLALPVLAGHREMVTAVSGFAHEARDAWHVLYFAAAAGLLAWLGRGGRTGARQYLTVAALVLAGVAGVKTLIDVEASYGANAWSAAQLTAAILTPLGIAWCAVRGRREHVFAALLLMGSMIIAFLMHVIADHLPTGTPFLDLRFGVGLLAIAALRTFPYYALAAGLRKTATTYALLGGLALGFLLGLMEVWALVKGLSDAWPAVLMSIYMALFAGATLTAGFVRGDKRLRWPALGLFGAVVLKVGLYDLATAALTLRIFVTGILGLVLLAAAFAYARRTSPPGELAVK